jgi:hypothetical protein
MSGAQGQPWCAAFVLAGLELTGTTPYTRSVYVPTITDVYVTVGAFHPIADAQPGDQVDYDIGDGHTGIVINIDPQARTVTAIEGNTSPGDTGSQNNGGGVYQRVRDWSVVIGAGRPNFDQEDLVAASDVIAEVQVSPSAIYQLERGGGVRVVSSSPSREPLEDEPFWDYYVVANDGSAYYFGPDRNNGEFSYPGLPDTSRLGDRYFVAINVG